MPQKLTKTHAELEILLMAELRMYPECSNVDAVAITRPVGRPWDVAVIRDGPQYSDGVPEEDLVNHRAALQ